MINMSQNMLYHIDNLNMENKRISYSMASGKAIDKGSDDSMLHSRLINLDDKLRVSESLQLQLTKTKAINDTADDSLAETKVAMESIKIDLLKALNDGMDRSDKLAVATNFEGILGNIYDMINTHIDGEYIFSGSVSTNETLVKDPNFDLNGRIDFGGDGFLREVAVQPGSYRDRGITAYDAVFYNASSAASGESFTFSDRERIIDENGHEWKVLDDLGGIYDPSDLTRTPTTLQQYDHNGVMYNPTAYPASQIAIAASTAEVEATSTAQAQRATYTVNLPATPEGRVMEAKHNYFDDLNEMINALKGHATQLDGTKGSVILDDLVDDTVRNGLNNSSLQYDATNIGHGELGGRNHTFNNAQDRIAAQITNYNILLQEYGGADIAKLAMESKSLEMTYQSLYSTIAKMGELSIMNYLK
ncbi:MAG: hypothetical protein U9Q20_03370 [Campylobacterota bacterium]|nr:hypothetical protein [Campylobacterota bacterium]